MDINIIGTWMNDTVLYLARILGEAGGSVLIRDYTRDHQLSCCVPSIRGIDPSEEIIDYSGIGYTFSRSSSEKYDTTVRLYDFDRLPDNEEYFTLIIADESKMVSDTLNAMDWSDFTERGTQVVLLVKYYTGVVRKQFEMLKKNAGIKKVWEIPLDSQNMKCAMLAEHNDVFIFTGITTHYREALEDLIRLMRPDLGLSQKEAEVLVKKAAKGGKR